MCVKNGVCLLFANVDDDLPLLMSRECVVIGMIHAVRLHLSIFRAPSPWRKPALLSSGYALQREVQWLMPLRIPIQQCCITGGK
jgi:hypothetical protein